MEARGQRGIGVDGDVILVSRCSWGGMDKCADYGPVDVEGHIGITVWRSGGEGEGTKYVYSCACEKKGNVGTCYRENSLHDERKDSPLNPMDAKRTVFGKALLPGRGLNVPSCQVPYNTSRSHFVR